MFSKTLFNYDFYITIIYITIFSNIIATSGIFTSFIYIYTLRIVCIIIYTVQLFYSYRLLYCV